MTQPIGDQAPLMPDAYQAPAEDVYPSTTKPLKTQANATGDVLWFAEGYGWYVGAFTGGHMPNTTYWTYIPDRPACNNSNALRDCEFDRWMLTFTPGIREVIRDTMVSPFHAGWRLARQPNANH